MPHLVVRKWSNDIVIREEFGIATLLAMPSLITAAVCATIRCEG
jgi:hypothetical protein